MKNISLTVLIMCAAALAPYSMPRADNSHQNTEAGTGVNWAHHGGGVDEAGYSQLTAINANTIGRLGLAWSLDLPNERLLEATPLAVDGVLYFTGNQSDIYAVNAVSGKLIWQYDPEVGKHYPIKMRQTVGYNRGAAYDNGRVFAATTDGRLLALDAKTGKLIWSVETVQAKDFLTSTGAPRTFKGKVIIGNGGGDFGARGYVTAYDQNTGKQVWRFYCAPGSPEENKGDPAMERAAETWRGEWWKTGTGGTPWNGITFDPELNQIYIGTGNSGPYDPEVRSPGGGDNLYLVSIVAVDADTGKYKWHYQMNPREAWDFKATMNMISTTLEINGKPRKVLMQTPTNGFFYVLDRQTGELLSAEKTGKVTWAERIDMKTGRPVEIPNLRYEAGKVVFWPSGFGTHNWQAMSYNPQTGLVYIPYMQLGISYEREKDPNAATYTISKIKSSLVFEDEHDGKAALLAWDPVAQKERWRVWHDTFWNGGTLSTAGNLVFQGTADGYLSAYDAASGKLLWHFYAGLGIVAAPMSYSVGGKQYISVLVGHGGPTYLRDLVRNGWKYGAQPRRLLTFVLDGKSKLPPTAPPDFTYSPLDDPKLQIQVADVKAGEGVYLRNCAMCHGREAISRGAPAPDLRESRIALYSDALWTVLHEGPLVARGMPLFDDLSRQQVDQLHAYIRSAARDALSKPKP